MPVIIRRWKMKKTSRSGNDVTVAPAVTRLYSMKYWFWNIAKPISVVYMFWVVVMIRGHVKKPQTLRKA